MDGSPLAVSHTKKKKEFTPFLMATFVSVTINVLRHDELFVVNCESNALYHANRQESSLLLCLFSTLDVDEWVDRFFFSLRIVVQFDGFMHTVTRGKPTDSMGLAATH
jgi:hypothetical protein